MKRTLVVFLHGAWFHKSSWDGWAERFASHGFAVHVQGWPDEDPGVAPARRGAGRLRDLELGALIAHHEDAVRSLDTPPVLIGHAVGGLIAQRLLGEGLARAAVALAPLPGGAVPLDNAQTRSWSVFAGESAEERQGLVTLPPSRFRHAIANTVGEEEAARLFRLYAVPAPRRLFVELEADDAAGTAVDTRNPKRGPLLLISGQEDRIVPDAAVRAAYKLYGDSTAVTELKQFADRGHSLVIDSGWPAIADYVLAWLAANGITHAAR